jgi:hypothetical protein
MDSCQSAAWNSSSLSISAVSLQYLSNEESLQIRQQFEKRCRRDRQVFWSGVPYQRVQPWAEKRRLETLKIAMGPLMKAESPLCLRRTKTLDQWKRYIKGASAIFALYVLEGKVVTLLLPPPLERFHPSGNTSYQAVEEPILKSKPELRIEVVHLTVPGAEDFRYQLWPVDEIETWIARFGIPHIEHHWRMVKKKPSVRTQDAVITSPCNIDKMLETVCLVHHRQLGGIY